MTRRTGLASFLGQRWAFVFLLLELVLFSFLGGGFFSLNGFQIILFYSTTLALLATAQTFVIVSGGPGIDLSVGFVMGLATVVSARLAASFSRLGLAPELSLLLAIVITLAMGLLPGLVNGLLVARLKVPPFLATFGVQGITYGAALDENLARPDLRHGALLDADVAGPGAADRVLEAVVRRADPGQGSAGGDCRARRRGRRSRAPRAERSARRRGAEGHERTEQRARAGAVLPVRGVVLTRERGRS